MFRGVKAINLDAKGRMVLPTRYHDALHERCQGSLVVTADAQDACLLLYPLPDWEEIERKVDALSSFNRVTQGIKRRLIGNATDLDMDSSGRVLLPPKLRELAGLEKKVVLVGQRNKFEIWDEEVWNQAQQAWQEQGGIDEDQIPDEIKNLSL